MNAIEYINSRSTQARWTGIILIVLGVLALLSPLAAGLSVSIIAGSLILLAGAGVLLLSLGARSIPAGLLVGLLGCSGVFAGGYMILNPAAGLAALTLTIAIYFVVAGIIEIVAALQARPLAGWGWLLSSGILSLLLGMMIWGQFPFSGAWAVGLLVGIRILISGVVLVSVAGAVEQAARKRS